MNLNRGYVPVQFNKLVNDIYSSTTQKSQSIKELHSFYDAHADQLVDEEISQILRLLSGFSAMNLAAQDDLVVLLRKLIASEEFLVSNHRKNYSVLFHSNQQAFLFDTVNAALQKGSTYLFDIFKQFIKMLKLFKQQVDITKITIISQNIVKLEPEDDISTIKLLLFLMNQFPEVFNQDSNKQFEFLMELIEHQQNQLQYWISFMEAIQNLSNQCFQQQFVKVLELDYSQILSVSINHIIPFQQVLDCCLQQVNVNYSTLISFCASLSAFLNTASGATSLIPHILWIQYLNKLLSQNKIQQDLTQPEWMVSQNIFHMILAFLEKLFKTQTFDIVVDIFKGLQFGWVYNPKTCHFDRYQTFTEHAMLFVVKFLQNSPSSELQLNVRKVTSFLKDVYGRNIFQQVGISYLQHITQIVIDPNLESQQIQYFYSNIDMKDDASSFLSALKLHEQNFYSQISYELLYIVYDHCISYNSFLDFSILIINGYLKLLLGNDARQFSLSIPNFYMIESVQTQQSPVPAILLKFISEFIEKQQNLQKLASPKAVDLFISILYIVQLQQEIHPYIVNRSLMNLSELFGRFQYLPEILFQCELYFDVIQTFLTQSAQQLLQKTNISDVLVRQDFNKEDDLYSLYQPSYKHTLDLILKSQSDLKKTLDQYQQLVIGNDFISMQMIVYLLTTYPVQQTIMLSTFAVIFYQLLPSCLLSSNQSLVYYCFKILSSYQAEIVPGQFGHQCKYFSYVLSDSGFIQQYLTNEISNLMKVFEHYIHFGAAYMEDVSTMNHKLKFLNSTKQQLDDRPTVEWDENLDFILFSSPFRALLQSVILPECEFLQTLSFDVCYYLKETVLCQTEQYLSQMQPQCFCEHLSKISLSIKPFQYTHIYLAHEHPFSPYTYSEYSVKLTGRIGEVGRMLQKSQKEVSKFSYKYDTPIFFKFMFQLPKSSDSKGQPTTSEGFTILDNEKIKQSDDLSINIPNALHHLCVWLSRQPLQLFQIQETIKESQLICKEIIQFILLLQNESISKQFQLSDFYLLNYAILSSVLVLGQKCFFDGEEELDVSSVIRNFVENLLKFQDSKLFFYYLESLFDIILLPQKLGDLPITSAIRMLAMQCVIQLSNDNHQQFDKFLLQKISNSLHCFNNNQAAQIQILHNVCYLIYNSCYLFSQVDTQVVQDFIKSIFIDLFDHLKDLMIYPHILPIIRDAASIINNIVSRNPEAVDQSMLMDLLFDSSLVGGQVLIQLINALSFEIELDNTGLHNTFAINNITCLLFTVRKTRMLSTEVVEAIQQFLSSSLQGHNFNQLIKQHRVQVNLSMQNIMFQKFQQLVALGIYNSYRTELRASKLDQFLCQGMISYCDPAFYNKFYDQPIVYFQKLQPTSYINVKVNAIYDIRCEIGTIAKNIIISTQNICNSDLYCLPSVYVQRYILGEEIHPLVSQAVISSCLLDALFNDQLTEKIFLDLQVMLHTFESLTTSNNRVPADFYQQNFVDQFSCDMLQFLVRIHYNSSRILQMVRFIIEKHLVTFAIIPKILIICQSLILNALLESQTKDLDSQIKYFVQNFIIYNVELRVSDKDLDRLDDFFDDFEKLSIDCMSIIFQVATLLKKPIDNYILVLKNLLVQNILLQVISYNSIYDYCKINYSLLQQDKVLQQLIFGVFGLSVLDLVPEDHIEPYSGKEFNTALDLYLGLSQNTRAAIISYQEITKYCSDEVKLSAQLNQYLYELSNISNQNESDVLFGEILMLLRKLFVFDKMNDITFHYSLQFFRLLSKYQQFSVSSGKLLSSIIEYMINFNIKYVLYFKVGVKFDGEILFQCEQQDFDVSEIWSQKFDILHVQTQLQFLNVVVQLDLNVVQSLVVYIVFFLLQLIQADFKSLQMNQLIQQLSYRLGQMRSLNSLSIAFKLSLQKDLLLLYFQESKFKVKNTVFDLKLDFYLPTLCQKVESLLNYSSFFNELVRLFVQEKIMLTMFQGSQNEGVLLRVEQTIFNDTSFNQSVLMIQQQLIRGQLAFDIVDLAFQSFLSFAKICGLSLFVQDYYAQDYHNLKTSTPGSTLYLSLLQKCDPAYASLLNTNPKLQLHELAFEQLESEILVLKEINRKFGNAIDIFKQIAISSHGLAYVNDFWFSVKTAFVFFMYSQRILVELGKVLTNYKLIDSYVDSYLQIWDNAGRLLQYFAISYDQPPCDSQKFCTFDPKTTFEKIIDVLNKAKDVNITDLRKDGYAKVVTDQLLVEAQSHLNEKVETKEFDVAVINNKEKRFDKVKLFLKSLPLQHKDQQLTFQESIPKFVDDFVILFHNMLGSPEVFIGYLQLSFIYVKNPPNNNNDDNKSKNIAKFACQYCDRNYVTHQSLLDVYRTRCHLRLEEQLMYISSLEIPRSPLIGISTDLDLSIKVLKIQITELYRKTIQQQQMPAQVERNQLDKQFMVVTEQVQDIESNQFVVPFKPIPAVDQFVQLVDILHTLPLLGMKLPGNQHHKLQHVTMILIQLLNLAIRSNGKYELNQNMDIEWLTFQQQYKIVSRLFMISSDLCQETYVAFISRFFDQDTIINKKYQTQENVYCSHTLHQHNISVNSEYLILLQRNLIVMLLNYKFNSLLLRNTTTSALQSILNASYVFSFDSHTRLMLADAQQSRPFSSEISKLNLITELRTIYKHSQRDPSKPDQKATKQWTCFINHHMPAISPLHQIPFAPCYDANGPENILILEKLHQAGYPHVDPQILKQQPNQQLRNDKQFIIDQFTEIKNAIQFLNQLPAPQFKLDQIIDYTKFYSFCIWGNQNSQGVNDLVNKLFKDQSIDNGSFSCLFYELYTLQLIVLFQLQNFLKNNLPEQRGRGPNENDQIIARAQMDYSKISKELEQKHVQLQEEHGKITGSMQEIELQIKSIQIKKDEALKAVQKATNLNDQQQLEHEKKLYQQFDTEYFSLKQKLNGLGKRTTDLSKDIENVSKLKDEEFSKFIQQLLQSKVTSVSQDRQYTLQAAQFYAQILNKQQAAFSFDANSVSILNSNILAEKISERLLLQAYEAFGDKASHLGLLYPISYRLVGENQLFAYSHSGKKLYELNSKAIITDQQNIFPNAQEKCFQSFNRYQICYDPKQSVKDSKRVNQLKPRIVNFRNRPTFTRLGLLGDAMNQLYMNCMQRTSANAEYFSLLFDNLCHLYQDSIQRIQRGSVKDTQDYGMPIAQQSNAIMEQLRKYIRNIVSQIWKNVDISKNSGTQNAIRQALKCSKLFNSQNPQTEKSENFKTTFTMFEKDTHSNEILNLLIQNLLNSHQYADLDQMSYDLREEYLKKKFNDKTHKAFTTQIEIYQKATDQIEYKTREIVNPTNYTDYLQQLIQKLDIQDIFTQYLNKQAPNDRTQLINTLNPHFMCQVIALLNSVFPGHFDELHGAFIPPSAVFSSILGLAAVHMKIELYQSVPLDFDTFYSSEVFRKVLESYSTFSALYPDVAIESVLKQGILRRQIGETIQQARQSDSREQLNKISCGDVAIFIILVFFLIQKDSPSSIAPGPSVLFVDFPDSVNNQGQSQKQIMKELEIVEFDNYKRVSYAFGLNILNIVKNAIQQDIKETDVIPTLEMSFQSDAGMLQYKPQTILLLIQFAVMQPIENKAFVNRLLLLLRDMIIAAHGRKSMTNCLLYQEYSEISDLVQLNYYIIINSREFILQFIGKKYDQSYVDRMKKQAADILSSYNQLFKQFTNKQFDLQLSERDLSSLATNRLIFLTSLQHIFCTPYSYITRELDNLDSEQRNQLIQFTESLWQQVRELIITVRFQSLTNLMLHALKVHGDPVAAVKLGYDQLVAKWFQDKLYCKDETPVDRAECLNIEQKFVLERIRVEILSQIYAGNIQTALSKIQEVNKKKINDVCLQDEFKFIEAFIYELYIDIGQISYSQISQEIFNKVMNRLQETPNKINALQKHYYGCYITFEESLDSFIRQEFSNKALAFQRIIDKTANLQFQSDTIDLTSNVIQSLFEMFSVSHQVHDQVAIAKLQCAIVSSMNSLAKHSFQKFLDWFMLPPKFCYMWIHPALQTKFGSLGYYTRGTILDLLASKFILISQDIPKNVLSCFIEYIVVDLIRNKFQPSMFVKSMQLLFLTNYISSNDATTISRFRYQEEQPDYFVLGSFIQSVLSTDLELIFTQMQQMRCQQFSISHVKQLFNFTKAEVDEILTQKSLTEAFSCVYQIIIEFNGEIIKDFIKLAASLQEQLLICDSNVLLSSYIGQFLVMLIAQKVYQNHNFSQANALLQATQVTSIPWILTVVQQTLKKIDSQENWTKKQCEDVKEKIYALLRSVCATIVKSNNLQKIILCNLSSQQANLHSWFSILEDNLQRYLKIVDDVELSFNSTVFSADQIINGKLNYDGAFTIELQSIFNKSLMVYKQNVGIFTQSASIQDSQRESILPVIGCVDVSHQMSSFINNDVNQLNLQQQLLFNKYYYPDQAAQVFKFNIHYKPHIIYIDSFPVIQYQIIDQFGEKQQILSLSIPDNEDLQALIQQVIPQFSLSSIYSFQKMWQKVVSLFTQDLKLYEVLFVTNRQLVLRIMQKELVVSQLYNVKQPQFKYNYRQFYQFRSHLCQEIAILMLVHQLFGINDQVLVSNKSVDLLSGQLINFCLAPNSIPIQQVDYKEYLTHSIFFYDVLNQNSINDDFARQSDRNPEETIISKSREIRVVIDKFVLELIQPHVAIGTIGIALGKMFRQFALRQTVQRYDYPYQIICYKQCQIHPSNLSSDFSQLMQQELGGILLNHILLNQSIKQQLFYSLSNKDEMDIRSVFNRAIDAMCRCITPALSNIDQDEDKRKLNSNPIFCIDSIATNSSIKNMYPCPIEWVVQSVAAQYE